jgi:alginate O-acetyltransferase complex protein AlgJ
MFPRAFIAIFCAVCLFTWVDFFFHVDPTFSLEENRTLAVFPKFHFGLTAMSEFPSKVNSFFDDNFGFRRLLIKGYGMVMLQAFQTPAYPSVIQGKEDWLFLAGHYGLEYYQTKTPFSETELAHWAAVLERNRAQMQQRGSRYLIVFAPNKDTVYSEYMPDNIVRFHQESRMDQLIHYLGTHSDLEFLDLRPALLQAKTQSQVYDRTDTHWNGNGAYAGYETIIERLHAWYPPLSPLMRKDFIFQTDAGTGDLAGVLGLTDLLSDKMIRITPSDGLPAREVRYVYPPFPSLAAPDEFLPRAYEIADPSLPRLVMFHDSFGLALIPILAEHFQRSVYYRTEYLARFENPMAIVDKEHPDVVIFEMVERSLQWPIFDLSNQSELSR